MSLKIEYVKVDEINEYENNTRRHEEHDVHAIANSIEQFGFSDPIGVWGKANTIVEGHGRYLAALELGLDEVPVIRLDHLSDEERRAYAIAHNKTAEQSDWDMESLADEIKDLEKLFDMTDFGFGEFELMIMKEDLMPEPKDKDIEDEYGGDREQQYLKKHRIIINYDEETEEKLLELLGMDKIEKVVYTVEEILNESHTD